MDGKFVVSFPSVYGAQHENSAQMFLKVVQKSHHNIWCSSYRVTPHQVTRVTTVTFLLNSVCLFAFALALYPFIVSLLVIYNPQLLLECLPFNFMVAFAVVCAL